MGTEMWFADEHTPNVKLNIRVKKQLFSDHSDIQRVDVFDSEDLGKFISLDGNIVFSERDEFIYDEMVVHVPMAVHQHAKKVLVIGGGDGGVAKELCRYDEIETIDVVEEDEMFVEVSKRFFPDTAEGLEDKRVNLYIQDGLKFIRGKVGDYDLIINDSTDPFGPTEGLFTREFYGSCYKALNKTGILVYQHGSPFYDVDRDECCKMHQKVYSIFPISRVYQAHIPTCSSGYWLFGFASKKYHPVKDLDADAWDERKIHTKYYTTNVHKGSFMLPKYVEDMLRRVEKGKEG
ncbi:MAG: polyamine aminopropyltransferase [Clostridia bacterium]|nr:polyamine aminopropyltransferase [Clostridia bacterium]